MLNSGFAANVDYNSTSAPLIEVAQQLLLSAKTHEPTDLLIELIRTTSARSLMQELNNDNIKKAFWINIYNAYTQIILSKNPGKYRKRASFFSDKQIETAWQKLSLDDIEHGILRHSKVRWGFGYLNKWFPSSFEKQQRVRVLDYRIHFSLNCGAVSCPPIAFYTPEQLDKQLDMATKVYLQNEVVYDEAKNIVALPAIMGWFRGDFGGRKKIIALLQQLEIVPKQKYPSIRFKAYNWNIFLENYKSA